MLSAYSDCLIAFFTSTPEGKNFSCADMDLIISKFNCVTFKNNEEFCGQNKICGEVGIIYSGIFKAESTYANGEKKIRAMFFEPYNSVVVDCYSFENGVVSNQRIVSRIESTLLVISKYNLNYLSRTFPDFGIIMRNMLTKSCEAHKLILMEYEQLSPLQKRQKFDACFAHVIDDLTREEKAFLTGAGKNIF